MQRVVKMTLLALALAQPLAGVAAEPERPGPELAPAEVIGIVLQALARPDRPEPDAGIERTFRFASPDNRAQTGPLPRFIALVKNPVYAPLLGHERAIRGGVKREGERAWERVRVVGEDGRMAAYVFVLSRQGNDAECAGCWMTDAVMRVEPEGLGT
jgi:hypothetical protein